MAIGGYETPVVYGHTQIFDPTMAAMVLDVNKRYGEALRAEYERGLKDLEDFSAKYGDFVSPFSKDMERYGEMMGNIKQVIDQAYANGIDLTRSPEGRLLISRMTHSIDPGEYNNMRANAKLGYEYLDAIEKAKAKNEFNQSFEDWTLLKENGGPGSFSDFSSAGGATWNRTAPYVYQDLNQFTGHIFDKMEDSFLGTGADHYDYYGVSREDRQKALTQHLSGLLSSSLGQYHYQNSKAAYERILGRPLSDSEAMAYWQNDILDSTQEYEHRNRKLNEMWKLQYEDASRQRAARVSSSTRNSTGGDQYSFLELVKRSGSTAIVGQQPQEYSEATLSKQKDAQVKIGSDISKATGGNSGSQKGTDMFVQAYGKNQYNPSIVATFTGYQTLNGDPTTVVIPKNEIYRLHSNNDVASHTSGFRGQGYAKTNNSKFENADYVVATVTGGSYQAFMKDERHKNYFTFNVKAYKKVPVLDENGNVQYDTNTQQPMTRLQLVASAPRQWDSHITSTQNAKGSASLGTYDKKSGKMIRKNVQLTNSQDYRYQDAVTQDKVVTDIISKGTIYGSDATLTELPGFGQ